MRTQYGALDNAISLLELNTQNYPASATAFSQLGDAYLKKGDRSKAVICYKKALALNPGLENVKTKLAGTSENQYIILLTATLTFLPLFIFSPLYH